MSEAAKNIMIKLIIEVPGSGTDLTADALPSILLEFSRWLQSDPALSVGARGEFSHQDGIVSWDVQWVGSAQTPEQFADALDQASGRVELP